MYCELLSYYEGLKLIEEELSALRREGFIQTAEDYGLRSLGLAASITEDTAAQTVTVDVQAYTGTLQNYEDVLRRVCDILPAHVGIRLNMGSVTWDLFDAQEQSYDERDAADLTWDAFENSAVTPI